MLHVGQPRHGNFERHRYLLLHFFRRAPGPLSDDLNVVVGNVRIGFDRKVVKRNCAPDKKQQGNSQNQVPVVESKIDKRPNHYWSTAFCSSSAFSTTFCPAAIPEVASCMPPGSMSPPTIPTLLNLPPSTGT